MDVSPGAPRGQGYSKLRQAKVGTNESQLIQGRVCASDGGSLPFPGALLTEQAETQQDGEDHTGANRSRWILSRDCRDSAS